MLPELNRLWNNKELRLFLRQKVKRYRFLIARLPFPSPSSCWVAFLRIVTLFVHTADGDGHLHCGPVKSVKRPIHSPIGFPFGREREMLHFDMETPGGWVTLLRSDSKSILIEFLGGGGSKFIST